MNVDVAITRDVARSIERCELTYIDRSVIDYERAVAQHRAYCERLEALGLEVVRLPADEAHPDCCFIEDTAVVLDELAVVTTMGSPSRRGETPAVAAALARFRSVVERIELPGTLDGGDVLVVGKRIFVGLTTRTNAVGVDALARFTAPHGYEVAGMRVPGCLHLKSAVTALDDETLLANRAFLDEAEVARLLLPHFRIIDVDDAEPGAANVLRVPGEILAHPGYPRTLELLERAGYRVGRVDISEFVKAEGALTCKGLLFTRGCVPEPVGAAA